MNDRPLQPHIHSVNPAAAATAWAALCAFILYGSAGVLSTDGARGSELPGISLPDVIQNVLLYIPFGACGAWTMRPRVPHLPARSAIVLGLALVYSIAMELLQTATAARIASPMDVVSNIVGTGVGVLLAAPVGRALSLMVDCMRSMGLLSARSRYALLAVFVVIVVVAWYPFDITLDISTLSERTRPVRRDPWLRPAASQLWRHGVSFFALAALTTLSLPGLGRWAAAVAAVLTIAAALVIDVGQVGMGRYAVGVAAFLSQAAGSCAGAAVAFLAVRALAGRYVAA